MMNQFLLARYRALSVQLIEFLLSHGEITATLYAKAAGGDSAPTMQAAGQDVSTLKGKADVRGMEIVRVLMQSQAALVCTMHVNADLLIPEDVQMQIESAFEIVTGGIVRSIIRSGGSADAELKTHAHGHSVGILTGYDAIAELTFSSKAGAISCQLKWVGGETTAELQSHAHTATAGTTKTSGLFNGKSKDTFLLDMQLIEALQTSGSAIAGMVGSAMHHVITAKDTAGETTAEMTFKAGPETKYIEAVYIDPIQTGTNVFIQSVLSFDTSKIKQKGVE